MKKWIPILLTVMLAGMIFWSCSDDDGGTEPSNYLPTCAITSPVDSATFTIGDNITVEVDADDSDGNIFEVRFYFDGVQKDSDQSSPYSYAISTASFAPGTYTINTIAEDNDGGESSNQINVNLTAPVNNPPEITDLTVSATSVQQGGTVDLSCSATDIDGDSLTYSWISTGGNLSTTTGSNIVWTAPNINDTYTITVTVSDGQDSDTDSKVITVTDSLEIVLVQGGTYQMGDHFNEGSIDETPLHSVTVSDFYMGVCEVTQSEWITYMPAKDWSSYGTGDNYPAYSVCWYEIMVYCNKRSIAEGFTPCYTINSSTDPDIWGTVPTSSDSTWNAVECNWSVNGYRLPTEAEWEYAARGGSHHTDDYRYSGSDTVSTVAWYTENNNPYGSKPTGTKAPNQLEIYDMTGNLYEWCWDWYESSYYTTCNDLGTVTDPYGPTSGTNRVLRGGGWASSTSTCRVAYRYKYFSPNSTTYDLGFRIVRTP